MVQNEILLINDGSFLLRMIGRRLESKGYPTWITDDPEKALEILSNFDFDLVVIKLSEEDVERLAALQMIKELSPDTKLVIISDSDFLPIEVFEADFDDYLSVPCSPNKLWRRLALFLEEPVDQQKNLFLHPANYRIVQRLVDNLQEIYQNLRDGEEGLQDVARAGCLPGIPRSSGKPGGRASEKFTVNISGGEDVAQLHQP